MDWTVLATNVPFIAVFVWFALELNKRQIAQSEAFMAALDKRDNEYEQRNMALVTAITKLSEQISGQTERLCTHDEVTRATLAQLIPAAKEPTTQRRPKAQ
ncbi:conserved hypothetical protein [Gammaproteobacteria bacterium]